MACRVIRDTNGNNLYRVPKAKTVQTPGHQLLPGSAFVDVWWDREVGPKRNDEQLMIRQENEKDRADVIVLTLGQVYDMIHALGWAVMRP